MITLIRSVLVVAILLLGPGMAAAQKHDGHDHDMSPRHGGQVTDLGAGHAELVLSGKAVQVYLYDGNMQAVSAQGAEVSVTLQVEGKRETIKLSQGGPNLMQGQSTLEAAKGARAVVALKLPGKPIVQARFAQ